MAFLLSRPESGHTERDSPHLPREAPASRPFSFIRTLTVGFGVAPNLLTLLPKRGRRRSRAWASLKETLTAGGDFHPALRTSAARNGRPVPKYDEALTAGQAVRSPKPAIFPCTNAAIGAPAARAKGGGGKVNEFLKKALPIPVCSVC